MMMNRFETGIRLLVIVIALVAPMLTSASAQAQNTGLIWAIDWSPDGTRIATGGTRGVVKIWNASNLTLMRSISVRQSDWYPGLGGAIDNMQWHPDNTRLAVGIITGNPPLGIVQVIDTRTEQFLMSTTSGNSVESVAWSPDGTRLAASGRLDTGLRPEGWLTIWDAASFQIIAELQQGHADVISQVAWSPDGTRLASAAYDETGYDNNIKIWDTTSWEPLLTLEHPAFAFTVAWSPDGTQVATGGSQVPGRIWDAATGQMLLDLQVPPDLEKVRIDSGFVSWSPDGSLLVSITVNNILFWDPATGDFVKRILSGVSTWNLTWSPDGTQLAYGHEGGTLKIVPITEINSGTPSAPQQ